ncbi:MAG: hypothetical protein R2912_01260 [Eubacteriales bacterium]
MKTTGSGSVRVDVSVADEGQSGIDHFLYAEGEQKRRILLRAAPRLSTAFLKSLSAVLTRSLPATPRATPH